MFFLAFQHKLLFDKVSSCCHFFYLIRVDVSSPSKTESSKKKAKTKLVNFRFERKKSGSKKAKGDGRRWMNTASGSSERRSKKERSWIFNVFHKYLHDCDIQKPTKTKYESHEKFLFLCKHYYLFNNLTPFLLLFATPSENIDYSPWGVIRVLSTYFFSYTSSATAQPMEQQKNKKQQPYVLFY